MRISQAVLVWAAVAAAEVPVVPVLADAQSSRVTLEADLSLPTLVRADSAAPTPLLRFNPMLLDRVDPRLGLFLFLHEEARASLGQQNGTIASEVSSGARSSVTRRPTDARGLQLQADCLAARRLVERAPSVLAAIADYFETMDDPGSDERASGSERAEMLKVCGQRKRAGSISL